MSAINGIRVKNLRSLKDTNELAIRKLNLLVGRNSGGKSTFARIFPLIRQSTEVRKRSPVLWYGRLVDFGSFEDTVRDSDPANKIELSFRVSLDKPNSNPVTIISDEESGYNVLASITLAPGKKPGETIVSNLEINFESIHCCLSFVDEKLNSIKVDDVLELINPTIHQQITFTGLLPTVDTYRYQNVKVGNQEFRAPVRTDVFVGPLIREIESMARTNVSSETVTAISDRFTFGRDNEILAQLRAQTDGPQKWVAFCRNMDSKNTSFPRIRNLILMARLPQIIDLIDESIISCAKNVSYLEPLRATAQRYYRRQELAVDELDSRGENVPFFLDNLRPYEKELLDEWLKKHFGISVETESKGGHIVIRLKIAESNRAVNLADTGFGFSQILPVALQLWKLTQGLNFSKNSDSTAQKFVVIEQPELHLHPAFQAKLGDIFTACIAASNEPFSYRNADLRITVETHSPTLINRIGELVSMGELSPDDVQVVLFDKDDESGITTTRVSEFARDGRLKNWPYGFFDAVDDFPEDRDNLKNSEKNYNSEKLNQSGREA